VASTDDVESQPKIITAPDQAVLPRKFLPPGRLGTVYGLYVQQYGGGSCSRELFRKVWRCGWDKVLRFRKRSDHSLCTESGP
jgi:hypothetical protein